nr:hypothetical protein SEVIR_6G146050v2 [Setaria viridis]
MALSPRGRGPFSVLVLLSMPNPIPVISFVASIASPWGRERAAICMLGAIQQLLEPFVEAGGRNRRRRQASILD